MNDRVKLNAVCRHINPPAFWPRSRIWARFSKYLERLLEPRFRSEGFPGDAAYIPRPEETAKINDSLESERSFLRFILGPTGIGKTTLTRTVLMKHAQVHVEAAEHELLIPIFCNGRSVMSDLFTMSIRAAGEAIDQAYGHTLSDLEYEKFLREHRRELLHAELVPPDSDPQMSIDALNRLHPYADAVARLKARLHVLPIEHVVIVCDDVESMNLHEQAVVLQQLGRLHTCLCDEKPRNQRIQAFFVCRTASFNELKGHTEPKVSPYMSEPLVIEIADAVPIGEVLEKRFAYLTNNGEPEGVKNVEQWRKAYEVLMRLSARLRGDHDHHGVWLENLLVRLCNFDMSAAFGEYLMLLTNSRYLEREHLRKSQGAFQLDPNDYDLSEASIYRALAMRDGMVYPGWETKLSNIFENWAAADSDLIVAYLLRFVERSGSKLQAEHNLLSVLFAAHPFLKRREEWVKVALEKLCSEGALLWEHSHERLIYLSPRAQTILRILQETSVLLDFARDDTWLPRNVLQSMCPTQQLKEDEKILARIAFLKHVTAVEHQHLVEVQSDGPTALATYTACFAGPLLSEHCTQGLRNTLYQHYTRKKEPRPEAVTKAFGELENALAANTRIVAQ